jgi:hypothetical protein
MLVLLGGFKRIAGPQAKKPLEDASERESRDDVARPMRQNRDPRQRETDRERSDRPAGPDRQSASRGRQRTHVQRVAGRKSVFALAGKGNAVDVPDHRSAVRSGLVE